MGPAGIFEYVPATARITLPLVNSRMGCSVAYEPKTQTRSTAEVHRLSRA